MEKLIESTLVKRLSNLSLSAVPPKFLKDITKRDIPDRLTHSIDTGRLSEYLPKEFEEWRKAILAAGILHDLGTPPFNHITDPIMRRVTGRDHEEWSLYLIKNTKIRDILMDEEVYDKVISIFTEYPYRNIMFGKMDLDNIDNIYKFHVALFDEEPYNKEELVKRFSIETFSAEPHPLWTKARERVYKTLQESKINMGVYAMLHRAIEIAYSDKELNPGISLFKYGDKYALQRLSDYAPRLMELLARRLIFRKVSTSELPRELTFEEKIMMTEEMARNYNADLEEISLLIYKDRISKDKIRWELQIYLSPTVYD